MVAILRSTFLQLILLHLSAVAFGQDIFLSKHLNAIESYIMEGYGSGWTHCDILHNTPSHKSTFPEYSPKVAMEMKHLRLDVSSTFSSAYCLMVSYHVSSNQSLSALIKFGWTVVQHKRLALVLKLASGVTLDMATNITKLPFLIATELEDGTEKFLCPVIGEYEPRLQNSICDHSYTSYEDKLLQVGLISATSAL